MITYTVKYEGNKSPKWVVRRDGKVVLRTTDAAHAGRAASDQARGEAIRTGLPVEVTRPTIEGVVEARTRGLLTPGNAFPAVPLESTFVWTPGAARENVEAIREICRKALAPGRTEP